jgi:protein required for attachment to host cells
MPKPKVLFLLADGARARFVERAPENGRFVTVQEIDRREDLRTLRNELRASPPSVEQGAAGSHSVEEQDFFRPAKEAFAAEIAEMAAVMVKKRAYEGVFLAAPARLMATLRRGLAGKTTITGEILRDLTQAPDIELSKWLPLRPMSQAT